MFSLTFVVLLLAYMLMALAVASYCDPSDCGWSHGFERFEIFIASIFWPITIMASFFTDGGKR